MTTMTARQQQRGEHPGVVALRAHIDQLRKNLEYWERVAGPTSGEEELVEQIRLMNERLELLRRHRAESEGQLATRKAEIEKLESTMRLAQEDYRVAQAVWLKLLTARTPKR